MQFASARIRTSSTSISTHSRTIPSLSAGLELGWCGERLRPVGRFVHGPFTYLQTRQ
jgi:hypothetical protein